MAFDLDILPVIDLLNGQAVHARLGVRARYQPVVRGDGLDGSPEAVLADYLAQAPFSTVYLADLDALSGQAPQWARIGALLESFEAPKFWVDAGLHPVPEAYRGRVRSVLGTESLSRPLSGPLTEDCVLSLDFRGDQFLGHPDLLNQSDWWPRRLIVMDLARVGSLDGPPLDRISILRQAHPDRQWYAAGGVRNAADLRRLADLGIQGALVATALLEGRLKEPEGLWVHSGE